jgi:hypothetical protein
MVRYFSSKFGYYLGIVWIGLAMFGCSGTDESLPDPVKDSLYFEFTVDGVKYKSEIKESNLIPGSGTERIDSSSPGMNFLSYNFFSNTIWMNFSNKCGSDVGRDCLDFQFQTPANLNLGSYPSLFTYGVSVNGKQFVNSYNGPERFPDPADQRINVVITTYDEVKKIVEGTVKGKLYKFQDPSAELVDFEGEFRVYIFKG